MSNPRRELKPTGGSVDLVMTMKILRWRRKIAAVEIEIEAGISGTSKIRNFTECNSVSAHYNWIQ